MYVSAPAVGLDQLVCARLVHSHARTHTHTHTRARARARVRAQRNLVIARNRDSECALSR